MDQLVQTIGEKTGLQGPGWVASDNQGRGDLILVISTYSDNFDCGGMLKNERACKSLGLFAHLVIIFSNFPCAYAVLDINRN